MRTQNSEIKSAHIFIKGVNININYITGEGNRRRFSTGMKDSKHNRLVIERQMYVLAQEHFERNRPSDSKTLFSEIALTALRSTSDNRSVEVQEDYEGLVERSLLPAFGSKAIGDIKPMHIEQWKSKTIATGMSKSRFHKHWTTLRMVMQYCTKNEMIEKNPMLLVERASKAFKPSANRSEKYYTPSEVSAMLEHSTGWFRAFLYTLFLTGMRTGEGLALQWKNIDFKNRKITIEHSVKKAKLKSTKTGKVRIVDMARALHDALKEHYKNRLSDVFVFPSYKTLKPYHGSNAVVRHYLKPLLKELGIEYKTIYATRHSFASNLVQNNVPITYVQKMLGHSKLETTMNFYVKNGLIDSAEMAPLLDQMYSA